MSVGVLLKAEWLKLAKLRGFWMILVMYVVFLLMITDGMTDRPRGAPALSFPTVWPVLLEFTAPITLMLCVSLIVITTATEFNWRTSRQNVIDGLSRNEWFSAKLMIALLIGALFMVVGLLATVSYSLMIGIEVTGQLVRATDVRLIGAFALALAGYLTFGLLMSVSVRNAGAVAVFLLVWSLFVETMLVEVLKLKGYTTAAKFFLRSVFGQLLQAERWDPDVLARLQARGRPTMEMWTNDQVVLLSLAYVALFISASYLVHNKRDL